MLSLASAASLLSTPQHDSTVFLPASPLARLAPFGLGSPPSSLLLGCYDCLHDLRSPFRFLHSELTAFTPSCLCLRSTDSRFNRRSCHGPGCCYAGSCPPPASYAEPRGSPRFLCSLLRLRPALRPRRSIVTRPSRGYAVSSPRTMMERTTRKIQTSRSSITRL